MAAPPEVTIQKLDGKFVMNKKLGDDQSDFFVLQGLGWLTRKAIGLATVTLTVKEFEKDGATHIDITQDASGLSTSTEYRVLNWTERDHQDKIFGSVVGKSRFFKKGELQVPEGVTYSEDDIKFLQGQTLKDGSPSEFADDTLIQSYVINSKDGWSVDQVWGFEVIDGERYYTRRYLCYKDGKTEKMRAVYQYLGPA